MKGITTKSCFLFTALLASVVLGGSAARAQISISDGQVSLAGQITVSGDVSGIHNAAFDCDLHVPLAQGDQLAAMVSDQGARSMDTTTLGGGSYPILLIVNGADGEGHSVCPATFVAKVSVSAGATVRSAGYTISARRAVNVGDSIPVFCIDGSIAVSSEAVEGANKPWLTAFPSDAKRSDRATALQVWGAETGNDVSHESLGAGDAPARQAAPARRTLTLHFGDKTSETPMREVGGSVLVPVRAFEDLGAVVEWTGDKSPIQVTLGSRVVTFRLGEKTLHVTDGAKTDTRPCTPSARLVGGDTTYLPLRAICEALGFMVQWQDTGVVLSN